MSFFPLQHVVWWWIWILAVCLLSYSKSPNHKILQNFYTGLGHISVKRKKRKKEKGAQLYLDLPYLGLKKKWALTKGIKVDHFLFVVYPYVVLHEKNK